MFMVAPSNSPELEVKFLLLSRMRILQRKTCCSTAKCFHKEELVACQCVLLPQVASMPNVFDILLGYPSYKHHPPLRSP